MYGLILIIGQAYAAEVTVAPSTPVITPGTDFNMNITIDPQNIAIAGAQLNIEFNRSLIRVNSVSEGDLFKQGGANTFFNNSIIDNAGGTVINIFDAIIGRKNVSTRGTLIIINITAFSSSGTSGMNLSNIKISDPNGSPVAMNATNGSVRINGPPVLAAIGNRIVDEGQTSTFTLSATDPDGSVLTFTASNLPTGASFNPVTRIFNWTPNYTQSGTYSNVHFEVSDGFYTVYENITITVSNVNRPPTLTLSPANGTIFNTTDTILIKITANDPDNDFLGYIIKIDGIQVSTSSSYQKKMNNRNSGFHIIEASVTDGKVTVTQKNTIYIRNSRLYFNIR